MAAMIQSGLDITHRFGIDDFQKGFDAMRSGQTGKVILDWGRVNSSRPGNTYKMRPWAAFCRLRTKCAAGLDAELTLSEWVAAGAGAGRKVHPRGSHP